MSTIRLGTPNTSFRPNLPPPSQSTPAPVDQAPTERAAPTEKFSYSKGAFADGIGAAGQLVTDLTGLGVGGVLGLGLGAAATAMAVTGLGIAGAPIAAGIVMVGMGVGALLGAGGGASLADKVSNKVGQWGSKLAERLGASQKTGEAVGRGALALAVTAPVVLTFGAGAAISAAPIAAGLMLTCGVANKGVNWMIDKFRAPRDQ